MKSIKLKDHPGENFTDCCKAILVDAERLGSAEPCKPEHLGYIIRIFEDTSDSRLRLWETQKYKEVIDFIKKVRVCDEDVIQPDDISNYGSPVQEAIREQRNIFESKRWEPTDNKKNYKYEYLLLMNFTVEIEDTVNKTAHNFYFKIHHKGRDNRSGVGSSTKSVVTCNKCGKKFHMKSN